MAWIGGHDAHTELYPIRLTACYGKDAQRIDAALKMGGPGGGKTVCFGASGLLDDLQW
jgi:hypothetical protein